MPYDPAGLQAKFLIDDDLELSNRIVMGPMTRARCDPGTDIPNDLMVQHYTQRATAGLIITEGTQISEQAIGWKDAPSIFRQEHVDAWKKVTSSVHESGGKIFLQLWHLGRQSHSSFHPSTGEIVSASDLPVPSGTARDANGEHVPYEAPRPLTLEEIRTTVQDYANAARKSKEAGFDGVEIHGANGYLVDQFLQTCSNVRTDEYGGSMENRVRFLIEIVEAIIADGAFPASRVGVRLSPNGAFGGMGSSDNDKLFPYVAERLSKYGLAYLHIMDGVGFGVHGLCPLVTCIDMKMAFKGGTIIANVGLTKDVAEGMLRSGAVDLACFGRPYISNPDLVYRFANDLPLNPDAPYEAWWHMKGAEGYNDFPFAELVEEKEAN
jgi:N-ethylmaleimide reductase